MTKVKTYLAGPMTSVAGFNFPLFNRVSEVLRASGWDIVNPADNGQGAPGDYGKYLRIGLQ